MREQALAEWEKVAEVGEQTGNAARFLHMFQLWSKARQLQKFNVCQLVTEQTNPAAKGGNIKIMTDWVCQLMSK